MNTNTITLLSQLKNASLNQKEFITVEVNHFTVSILEALYKEGLILSYKLVRKDGFLNNTSNAIVNIRYVYGKPVFDNLKFVSTPSHVRFLKWKQICRLSSKKYTFFFTTTQGILTIPECMKEKTGGILLFVC